MLDIEKELTQIKIKEIEPDESLVSQTKMRIRKINAKGTQRAVKREAKAGKKKDFHFSRWLSVAMVVAFVILVIPFGIIPTITSLTSPAYYTIDINPSVELEVNHADTITGVTCKNNDAIKLMANLDCIGQDITQAIPNIVSKARSLGYIKEDEENYLLIARFGQRKGTVTQEELDTLVTDAVGAMVRVMYLEGTLQDKQEADEQDISAGLLLLGKTATDNGIDPEPYEEQGIGMIGGIIDSIDKEQDYAVPQVSGGVEDGHAVLTWEKIEHEEFLGYKVVASQDNPAPQYPNDGYIKYITDANTTSMNLTGGNLQPDESYYFSVTALYEGNVCVPGNAVFLTIPKTTDAEHPSTTISGSVSGNKVYLKWDKIESDAFVGYKVVASATNENPKYPDDGYIKYITNANTTSLSVYEGYCGLKGGRKYYFSITVLYEGDIYSSGNAVYLKVPDVTENPTTTPVSTSEAMTSSTISGTIADGKVKLSWNTITNDHFSGYKVVKSKTNPNPKYPDDGYMSYITNANTTSISYPLSNFEPNTTYYFSITVLYDDGTKKAGNAISLTMPEGTETPEMTSTNISGSIDEEGTVHLSWGAIDHPNFSGYKVVKSTTNPNPKYPDDGYMSYITSAGTTSKSYSSSNFEPNTTYYFSITVLYDDGTKKAGNAISLTTPESEPAPEMTSTNISGSIDGEGKIHLYWGAIDHPDFDGYKVVYSKNPNPVYPDDPYKSWITNASTTSVTYNASDFDSGCTYYFSITVLYCDHSVKKAGNDVAISIP